MELDIISDITCVETIAAGRGVNIRHELDRIYGVAYWRKMKGTATVRLEDGFICKAEIHWYEAHGKGRIDYKIKRLL